MWVVKSDISFNLWLTERVVESSNIPKKWHPLEWSGSDWLDWALRSGENPSRTGSARVCGTRHFWN